MKRILIAALLLATFSAFSQGTVSPCGIRNIETELKEKYPEKYAEYLKNKALNEEHNASAQKAAPHTLYIIPVVFHVLHENGPENISEAQIRDAIRILNEDYNKLNPDTIDVIDEFKDIIGNAHIEFRLASLDPNGNITNGIKRYVTAETNNASIYDQANRIWPRNKYLNIFSAIDIGGAAGYTFNPGVGADIDGIMILHTHVGAIGTGSFNNSRSLTHEIGHWLNLDHTWGNSNDPGLASNCNMDDGVSDTPNTEGWQSCNLNGATCGSLDNVQNYMDYSYCSNMFTEGQVARMDDALNTGGSWGGYRNNLWTESNLTATGVNQLLVANFIADKNVACVGIPIDLTDYSYHAQSIWAWTMSNGQPSSSSQENPTVVYMQPGLQNISLSVSNGTSTLSKTKNSFLFITDSLGKFPPVVDGFETYTDFPNNSWYLSNPNEDVYKWKYNASNGFGASKCVKMDNYGAPTGQVEEFTSESVDLSVLATTTLSFKIAFALRTGNETDKLTLAVSKDCGETWLNVWNKSGANLASVANTNSNFVPSSDADWKDYTVTIPGAFRTENFIYKFVFQSGGGNNLYLDNINLTGTFKQNPILVWPLNNMGGRANNETLDWKAVPGCDFYTYEIDTTALFNSPLFSTGNITAFSSQPEDTDTKFQTSGLLNSQKYYWRVRTSTGGAASSWSNTWSFTVSSTGVGVKEEIKAPILFDLFPNPTNGSFQLKYSVEDKTTLVVSVYNILGERILNLNPIVSERGLHTLELNNDGSLSSGIYMVNLSGEGFSKTQKIIVR